MPGSLRSLAAWIAALGLAGLAPGLEPPARAADEVPSLRRSFDELCAGFFAESRTDIAIDDPRLLSEPVVGQEHLREAAMDLRSGRHALDHGQELRSAALYARYAGGLHGETVVLVTSFRGQDVPAWDGIVFGEDGLARANFSLKTIIGERPVETAIKAIERVQHFAFRPEPWLELFGFWASQPEPGVRVLESPEDAEAFDQRVRRLREMAELFGAPAQWSARPTRIVVDIRSAAPLPTERELGELRLRMMEKRGIIESVVFLRNGLVMEIFVDRVARGVIGGQTSTTRP